MIPLLLLAIETQDDRDFMSELYLSYQWLLYSEIHKIVQNHEATEDVLQSLLVKLIYKIELLRSLDRPQLIAYIAKAARLKAYDHIRNEKNRTGLPLLEDLDSTEEEFSCIDPQILLVETREAFRAAWACLDDRSRQILEMKCFLKYSNEEIAEAVGVSPASVRMLLSRARKNLRSMLFL